MIYVLTMIGRSDGVLGFPSQTQVWKGPRKFTKTDVAQRKQEFVDAIAEKFATSKANRKHIIVTHSITTQETA